MVKQFLCGFLTLLSTIFTSQVEYKGDQAVNVTLPGKWEVVEDTANDNSYGRLEIKNSEGDTFIAEFLPKPQRKITSLELMKEHRAEQLRYKVPHSIWKLIKAKSIDDAIFEWYVPQNDVYDTMYRMERVVMGTGGYHRIAFETKNDRPKDREKWIALLSNMEVNIGSYSRYIPKLHY